MTPASREVNSVGLWSCGRHGCALHGQLCATVRRKIPSTSPPLRPSNPSPARPNFSDSLRSCSPSKSSAGSIPPRRPPLPARSSAFAMSRLRALWQASINATKRAVVWNSEDLIPPTERYIFNFNSKDDLKRWHLYSDSEYGGLSSASLEITDGAACGNTSSIGAFSGNLSLDMSEGSSWKIRRSGFCGMRSKKFDGFIDLDAYDTIAMKIRGDGRCYISTIYTDNWVNSPGQQEDNSWQAFVYIPQDRWQIMKIPLDQYLPTWRGNVIEAKLEMNPARIVGMSLSVNAEGGVPGAKTGPGDFKLEVDWIKALRTL